MKSFEDRLTALIQECYNHIAETAIIHGKLEWYDYNTKGIRHYTLTLPQVVVLSDNSGVTSVRYDAFDDTCHNGTIVVSTIRQSSIITSSADTAIEDLPDEDVITLADSLQKTYTTPPAKTVFLVVHSSAKDCEQELQIRVFDTYDNAAACSRMLIQKALADWKESISDELTEYDSNQEYKDDEVLYEIYDKGNACDIFVNHREFENSESIHISEHVVE